MVPCALAGLYIIKWKLDRDWRSIILGSVIGLTGSGGQLILFEALKGGPAYIVFPTHLTISNYHYHLVCDIP